MSGHKIQGVGAWSRNPLGIGDEGAIVTLSLPTICRRLFSRVLRLVPFTATMSKHANFVCVLLTGWIKG